MNPAPKTFSYVAPKYARAAREIEDQLIQLIDAGENLALYYHRPQWPVTAAKPGVEYALVIGDGGFRHRIPIPSREFDRYAAAKNAVVVRFRGPDFEFVIRLRDVSDRRPRAKTRRDQELRHLAMASGPCFSCPTPEEHLSTDWAKVTATTMACTGQ